MRRTLALLAVAMAASFVTFPPVARAESTGKAAEVASRSPGMTSRKPSVKKKPSPSGGKVHVRGYTRRDGTYVAPHTRRAPRKRK